MGKCKFNRFLLERTDSLGVKISEWCKQHSDNEAYCIVCETVFKVKKGFQSLTQHVETRKHKTNISKISPLQLRLSSTVVTSAKTDSIQTGTSGLNESKTNLQPIGLYSVTENASRAELIWAMKNVVCNMSAASCEGISDTFQAMFPNCIPEGFSLSRTKLSYLVTEALGPYFYDQIINDIQNSYYSILYDETTNSENEKELQVVVRYWSETRSEVLCRHLQTFFLGHATADELSKHILMAIDNAKLSLNKMLMLGSDGPNVNKKVWRQINEEVISVRSIRNGLLNIGSCNIHIVHNAFLKGIVELGQDCSELALSVFYFFNGYPSRWDDYLKIQRDLNIPAKKFIKHVPSRWLTLRDSCVRLLEQCDSLEKYFLVFIPNKCSSLMTTLSYKKIVSLIKNKSYKAELHFVISSANLFCSFNEMFQRQEPLIHILYDRLHQLCVSLISRVCKSHLLEHVDTLNVAQIFEADNLLPLREVVVSDNVQDSMKHLQEKDMLHFLRRVQQHYIASCKHLIQKSSLFSSPNILIHFRFLQPMEKHSNLSCQDIVEVAKTLPLEIPIDILQDEWKILQLEKTTQGNKVQRIDHYWKSYCDLKDSSGSPKFPNVARVIKACLTLSHGNADLERGFSQSGRVLTDDKAAMSLRMLNSRLNIKNALQSYGNKPELVPITKELLTLARSAKASYNMYLEKKKIEKEMRLKQRQKDEEHKKVGEETRNRLERKRQTIEKLEENLKNVKKQHVEKAETSNKLFNEAHSRLKKALDKNNMKEARLAQAMFQGIQSIKEEEKLMVEKAQHIQKNLDEKKKSLITNFFQNTSKQ